MSYFCNSDNGSFITFPESSEKAGPKVTFLAMFWHKLLVANNFFRVNERRKGMDNHWTFIYKSSDSL